MTACVSSAADGPRAGRRPVAAHRCPRSRPSAARRAPRARRRVGARRAFAWQQYRTVLQLAGPEDDQPVFRQVTRTGTLATPSPHGLIPSPAACPPVADFSAHSLRRGSPKRIGATYRERGDSCRRPDVPHHGPQSMQTPSPTGTAGGSRLGPSRGEKGGVGVYRGYAITGGSGRGAGANLPTRPRARNPCAFRPSAQHPSIFARHTRKPCATARTQIRRSSLASR